jgi:hypothetical protein
VRPSLDEVPQDLLPLVTTDSIAAEKESRQRPASQRYVHHAHNLRVASALSFVLTTNHCLPVPFFA